MSPPPTTIILVRHADVHNPADIVYGRLPRFGLSATGRAEAARTAEALRPEPLAAIYSSPQLRARQTARAIAALHPGLPIHISRRLAEIRTGWQGTPNAEMTARGYSFYENPAGPDDETLATLTARMLGWVALMRRRHPGQVVLGVSHGDPVMAVRLVYAGQDPTPAAMRTLAHYPQKGAITYLRFADGPAPEVRYADPNLAARTAAGGPTPAAPWAARSAETANQEK